MRVEYIDVDMLKEHEEITHDHLNCLCDEIIKNRWVKPLLVDKDNYIILDGHHRFNALKKMGISKIPVILVDYFDDSLILLEPWREGEFYLKKDIVDLVKSHRKLPPKTTRHIIKKEFNYDLVNL